MSYPLHSFKSTPWGLSLSPGTVREATYKNGYFNDPSERDQPSTYSMYRVTSATSAREKTGAKRRIALQGANDFTGTVPHTLGAWQATYNSAYSRLLERVKQGGAQIGVLFGEWNKSFGMMANRLQSIADAALALYRLNWKKLAKIFRRSRGWLKRAYRRAKKSGLTLADLWLEWSFGWSPMVSDVGAAMDVLSQPGPKAQKVRAGKTDMRSLSSPSNAYVRRVDHCTCTINLGCLSEITNANAYLASRLGIVDVAGIAWELTPFSFLVDWVFDVSTFIGSFTDFVGVEATRKWVFQKTSHVLTVTSVEYAGKTDIRQLRGTRSLSFPRPMPNFQVFANLGTSMTRAANAAALLAQRLGRLRSTHVYIEV